MISLTRWTWVWVSSKRWWWTGRPGVLQSMGSQRVGNGWVTELKIDILFFVCGFLYPHVCCMGNQKAFVLNWIKRQCRQTGIEECPMKASFLMQTGRVKENQHRIVTYYSGLNGAMLSRFSRVQLCATPKMAAHQAPPSLRSSRQEHWSGLPFPSPMHESEWKPPPKYQYMSTP